MIRKKTRKTTLSAEGEEWGSPPFSRESWQDEYIAAPAVEELVDPVVVKWMLPYARLMERKKLNIIQNVLGVHGYQPLDFWQKLILLHLPMDQ